MQSLFEACLKALQKIIKDLKVAKYNPDAG
jgi:hypothetical protein